MRTMEIDLYAHYGLRAPKGGKGLLQCWIQDIPKEVSPCRKRPAVLIMPGGRYLRISEREGEPVALQFVARGYAAFVLQYSCAPLRFPVSLREAALAIRYIREHCAEFAVDPAMVATIGFSAGAHLCGLLGTMFDGVEVADLGDAAMLKPNALGLCYPVAVSWGKTHEPSFDNLCGEDTALRKRMSLDRLVRPDMPPVFIWHTRDDQTVPCRNSLVLATAVEAVGAELALHLYRKGVHGLAVPDITTYPAYGMPQFSADATGWLDAMTAFFREVGFGMTDTDGVQEAKM